MQNEIVSGKILSEWLDVSDRTVRDMADKEIVVRVGKGRYDLQASVIAVMRHQRAVAAGRGGANQVLDLTAERARLAASQADAQELKNATSKKELVPAEEVEREWADILRRVRSAMLAVPARLSQREPIDADLSIKIDREIREALYALADDKDNEPTGDGGPSSANENRPVNLDGKGVAAS